MNRRKFISMATLSSIGLSVLPLNAEINTNPWKATSVEEAIALLYGDKKIIQEDKIDIKAYYTACLFMLDVVITSHIEAKRIILLQDLNSIPKEYSLGLYALVSILKVPKDSLGNYSFTVTSMHREHTVVILIEDIKGNVYMNTSKVL